MEFDVKFKRCKLGDLVDISSSKRIFAKEYRDYGVPFYRSKEIIEKSSNQEISKPLYISEDKYEDIKSQFGVPQKGDLLLTSVGTLGIPYIVKNNDKFYFKDGNLTWFKNFNGLDNLFLYYWFLSPPGKKQIYGKHIGSTQKALTITNLKSFDLLIPTLDIQKNISKILYYFDKKIEINNKIIENLEAQVQAIFKSWFVDFEPFQDGNFVESELGLIPERWEVKEIKEISDRKNGYTYKSSDLSDDSSVNMVTIKNFNRHGGQNDDAKKPIKNTERVKKQHILEDKDILVACTDLTQAADIIGRVILYNENNYFDYEIYSMDVVKIVPHDITDTYFIYHYLNSNIFKWYAEGVATGTTVLHFPKKSIDSFKLIYPSKEYIEKFNEIIKPFIELEILLRNENSSLSQTRDTLLPKLMNGEIDVSNIKIDDEDIDYE